MVRDFSQPDGSRPALTERVGGPDTETDAGVAPTCGRAYDRLPPPSESSDYVIPNFEKFRAAAQRAAPVFLAAWWCALALSMVQLLLVAFRYYALGHIVWHSREIVWMAPLGNLLVFSVAALPIALLAPAMSPATVRRLSVGVFAGLAALGGLLLVPRIHVLAALLLRRRSTG